MSYNVINLIRLLHAWFYKSHHYFINQYMFSQKIVHSSFNIYIYIYIIDVQCEKSNKKHSYEFVLTQVVRLLHEIPVRSMISNTDKRSIISSKSN
jgi:hypothetical protein